MHLCSSKKKIVSFLAKFDVLKIYQLSTSFSFEICIYLDVLNSMARFFFQDRNLVKKVVGSSSKFNYEAHTLDFTKKMHL